ncbi:MAG TPA: CmcI family methyltransferase [Solirubrobacterales bacterium]|nr:CmcI family methyltransferase [Solirubrobacterales bacterium]
MASEQDSLTRRYLRLLRDALLDEHYLENELRIEHLLACARTGAEVDERRLADPALYMNNAFRLREQRSATGELPPGTPPPVHALALTDIGRHRLDHLEACLGTASSEGVAGDVVDCCSETPGAAIYLRGLLEALGGADRRLWMAAPFEGADSSAADGGIRPSADLNTIRRAFARFELIDDVTFLQGAPSRTLPGAPIGQIALLRIDGSGETEVAGVLEALYDRVSEGGFVIIDDHEQPSVRAAVDAFRDTRGIAEQLELIDASAAVWRKADPDAPAPAASLPAGATASEVDLSVVVVAHDMRREAARTLHSLSRAYQRNLDDVTYEVIVVENGSPPEGRLDEEFVSRFGKEFTLLDLGDDAHPSPAGAVNAGIAASSGRAVAVMIDGAHVLTPGVLSNGLLALSTYEPAIAAVKQWYVGPGQQPNTLAAGYDREFEDRLFEHVEWPSDGYRLFEVGHFIGARDWFDGDWESNCIFVPRSLIEQAGGMDESFSVPGGGFVNLDFYERMIGSPGVTLVTILGEGSFHQVHGGTTTNISKPEEREAKIRAYGDRYEELRGRRFLIPEQQTHYVGTLSPATRRTRRRPMSAEAFRFAGVPEDGRSSKPSPVPEALKTEFIDAFWRSDAWRQSSWLGTRTHRAPTDLLAYQELVCQVRPEWIVETRTGAGGRALFLASVCELTGHGRVLSVDAHPVDGRPEHERITYLTGDPTAEATAAKILQTVGEEANALVILGAAGGQQLVTTFNHLAPLVPVGSYVVFEDTILEGNPVWPAFGPGPFAALGRVLGSGEFVVDPAPERYALTFNPGGFLKRVRPRP